MALSIIDTTRRQSGLRSSINSATMVERSGGSASIRHAIRSAWFMYSGDSSVIATNSFGRGACAAVFRAHYVSSMDPSPASLQESTMTFGSVPMAVARRILESSGSQLAMSDPVEE